MIGLPHLNSALPGESRDPELTRDWAPAFILRSHVPSSFETFRLTASGETLRMKGQGVSKDEGVSGVWNQ